MQFSSKPPFQKKFWDSDRSYYLVDRPQTNPTNRILTELRENKRDVYDLMYSLNSRWVDQFTWEEQEHAWAVLELLSYWRTHEED